MGDSDVSSHERRELRKLENLQKRDLLRAQLVADNRVRRIKKIIFWSFGVLLIVTFVVWLFSSFNAPFTSGEVHWHATLEMVACGQKLENPVPFDAEHHLGLPLLHTHTDRLIHIEGQVWNAEDILLGKYMDVIGMPFTSDSLGDFVGPSGCRDGKVNSVRLMVNGMDNTLMRDYILRDGDNISLVYG